MTLSYYTVLPLVVQLWSALRIMSLLAYLIISNLP